MSGGPAMCWQPTAPTATASTITTTARFTSAWTAALPGRRETPRGPQPRRYRTPSSGRTWQGCRVSGSALPGSWQVGNEWGAGDVVAAARAVGNRFYYYNNGAFYFSVDGGAT